MYQHSVEVDSSASPASIRYPDVFNVAVPFIDRHLDELRAGKPAVVFADTGETVTYGQLAERVNRCGNLLRSLAGEPEGRVLMVVKDCPEFFYLFWGAIKVGLVPVPVNTLLRTDDYRHIIEDSGCAGLVYSPEYRDEVDARAGEIQPPAQLHPVHRGAKLRFRHAGGGVAGTGACRDLGRLRMLLAVFLGIHGSAQGGGAPPPRHRHHLCPLRREDAGRGGG